MVTTDVLATLQPSLLARARELDPDGAEDLLQNAYLRFVTHPPEATTANEVKRWFRTVLQNIRKDMFRARPVDWK
jgi:DNA-directed RNA polymerase specialized sigma24 family protein